MECQHISGCIKDGVVSLMGLGAFEFVPFCEEHAVGYIEYLEKLIIQSEKGFNRETLWCKCEVSKTKLKEYFVQKGKKN